ncbi:hypothetical protein Mpsy_2969 [Methanolobus psychrophilus R15]|nr:hypothetical protein Mpsy_2969 [Methanolobus psychrophilus R15]
MNISARGRCSRKCLNMEPEVAEYLVLLEYVSSKDWYLVGL